MGEVTVFQRQRYQYKLTRNRKMAQSRPKVQNNPPETDPQETEVYEILDNKLNIMVIKIFNELRTICINKMNILTKR